jgi:hypothetical protein
VQAQCETGGGLPPGHAGQKLPRSRKVTDNIINKVGTIRSQSALGLLFPTFQSGTSPDQEIPFPDREITFPDREITFPDRESLVRRPGGIFRESYRDFASRFAICAARSSHFLIAFNDLAVGTSIAFDGGM